MRRSANVLFSAVLGLAVVGSLLQGCATPVVVRNATFTALPSGVARSASADEIGRLNQALADASRLSHDNGTTSPARIDAVLDSGDTMVIWGGGQGFQTVLRDGEQYNVDGNDLGRLLEEIALMDEQPRDDPSIPRADEAGRTPAEIVRAIIAAKNAGRFRVAYSLHATPDVCLAIAEREWSEADERMTRFDVHETRVMDPNTALVRVSFEGSTGTGADRYAFQVEEPGEWWPVFKVDGLWRLKWLPRQ